MVLRIVISLALATLASAKTASCVVYTTPGCAYCTRAKTFLSARDVAYEEYDVSVDRSKLEEMIDAAGRSTLPQIFVGGEHIGGCDDLLAEHNAGTLKDRFERAGIVVLDGRVCALLQRRRRARRAARRRARRRRRRVGA